MITHFVANYEKCREYVLLGGCAQIITILHREVHWNLLQCYMGGHNGPKSLILAPQDIPDISGYQLGFGCQCVKAYNSENPVTNQKIL